VVPEGDLALRGDLALGELAVDAELVAGAVVALEGRTRGGLVNNVEVAGLLNVETAGPELEEEVGALVVAVEVVVVVVVVLELVTGVNLDGGGGCRRGRGCRG
jgi:hypothetical protein